MKKHQWTISGIMIAVVFIALEEESIPGVWAIPLAIIALILGGSIHPLEQVKLSEAALREGSGLKDFAEQMGMEFSAEVDDALIESLSAIAIGDGHDILSHRATLDLFVGGGYHQCAVW